ncbi:MAG: hypothetical protein J0M12_14945 [Deltaproteobacteria bacterium]|nr:hypothetical protein [Deltaproteobacteria bacterium]
MNLRSTALSVWLFLASTAHADIHLCGNVWTNRDCAAEEEARLEEKPYQAPNETQRLADRKKFMLNELDLRRLRVAREYKLNVEIESAREACTSAKTSLADCQKAVTEANEQLDKRVTVASLKNVETVKKEQSQTTTVVQVIDNTYLEKNRRRRHFDYDHEHGLRHPHPKGEAPALSKPEDVTAPAPEKPVPPRKPKTQKYIVGVAKGVS